MSKKNLLKNMSTSRKIAYLGIFTAIAVLVDILFYNFRLFGQNISFTPVVLFYISCWFGIGGGAIIAVVADFMSTLIFGTIGQYNPFLTLSALMLGILPAMLMWLPIQCKGGIFIKITLAFIAMFLASVLLENIIGMFFYYKVYLQSKMQNYYIFFWSRIATNTVVYAVNFVASILLFYPLHKISFLKLN